MHERIKLASVNPNKIVPSFIEWLSQAGRVDFDECRPMRDGEFRRGTSGERSGVIVPVKLNGEKIGELECCVNPPVVWYDGLRPLSLPKPRVRGIEKDWQAVLLGYSWESSAKGTRLDTWPIPFP